jgi:hypothetical protein
MREEYKNARIEQGRTYAMKQALATLVGAGAIAIVAASPALAGTGQCYDRSGRPIGPSYDTDRPNYDFNRWVSDIGGICRRIGKDFFGSNGRPYPREFTDYMQGGRRGGPRYGGRPPGPPREGGAAGPRPGGPPGPGYGRHAWSGNPGRVQQLLGYAYQRAGITRFFIRDTHRDIFIGNRVWRLFRVRYPGNRDRVAVRLTRRGQYLALYDLGGGQWGRRQFLGRDY